MEVPSAIHAGPQAQPTTAHPTDDISVHPETGAPTTFSTSGQLPAVSTGAAGHTGASASEQAFPDPDVLVAPVRSYVDGVAVVAPAGAHIGAIAKCAEFIHQEIGRNQFAQKKLAQAKATIVIIPAHTPMTDLPQFAGMRGGKTFDGRDWATVRGSGGIQSADGSFSIGVAEENLIAIKGVISGYPDGYSIGMHEFAHAVNTHGMTPAQQKRVEQLYQQHIAKDPGDAKDTFTDHYAASDSLEYYAQCTNAFFGKNSMPTNGNHNGRDWLAANDPDMYSFLVEMYETDRDEHGDAFDPATTRPGATVS